MCIYSKAETVLEEGLEDSDSHTERASDANDDASDSFDFGASSSDNDEETEDDPEVKTQPVENDVSGTDLF